MASKDVEATEAAELAALRELAAKRQQELSATAAALAGKLRGEGAAEWAKQAALRTTRRAMTAAWQTARKAASDRWRSGRVRRIAPVAVAVPAGALAITLTWRRVHARSAGRRRPRPGRPG